jgi:hypothetical protein
MRFLISNNLPSMSSRVAAIDAVDIVGAGKGGGGMALEVMKSILTYAQAVSISWRAWQLQKSSSIVLTAWCISDWGWESTMVYVGLKKKDKKTYSFFWKKI